MGFKEDDAHDACPDSRQQLERELNEAIAQTHWYATGAAANEAERLALRAELQAEREAHAKLRETFDDFEVAHENVRKAWYGSCAELEAERKAHAETRAELEQARRDENGAIADVQRYAERAEAAEKERDALFQRVQELEGAGRAACDAWGRVPTWSLRELNKTMNLLRKAVDAGLASDRPEGERVADALDLVLSVRFAPGQEREGMSEAATSAFALAFADTVTKGGGKGVRLRTFQKAGISSRFIAQALRDGVLKVAQKSDAPSDQPEGKGDS